MTDPKHMVSKPAPEPSASELERVDALLATLPPVEPKAGLVRETLARVEARASRGSARRRVPWMAGLVAASGTLAAALLVVAGGRRAEMGPPAVHDASKPLAASPDEGDLVGGGEYGRSTVVDAPAQGRGRLGDSRAGQRRDQVVFDEELGDGKERGAGRYRLGGDDGDDDLAQRVEVASKLEWPHAGQLESLGELDGLTAGWDAEGRPRDAVALLWKADANLERGAGPLGGAVETIAANEKGPPKEQELEEGDRVAADRVLRVVRDDQGNLDGQDERDARDDQIGPGSETGEQAPAFIEARGYFANTYLPGDAELSWLRAQVAAGLDELTLDGRAVAVETLAEPVAQPFDAPRDGALALYLASDLASFASEGAEGPRRATLQLGLKGAKRAPTHRSALNLALVVDMASVVEDGERRALWALTEALVKQAQADDRLTLVLHTGHTPVVVRPAPEEVTRVLAETYETRGGARPLSEAMDLAYGAVRSEAREDAVMGSELVILATPALITGVEAGLAERAHAEALRGVHLSTFGVGARVDLGATRSLALAGQGRASHIMAAERAPATVGGELSAAGRVVARAVRLRVRLGDGVQLVSVLGSRRLDATDADKVRTAERKIDLEVAETTGIRADRGADEDGIQVVIPAFMAGDDHVILFDVVVSRPGLVMDVRARFKDLMTLDNGEVSASLTLAPGRATPRAEQLNVTRNVSARKTSDALALAARRLQAGDSDGARRALAEGRLVVERLAQGASTARDPVLSGDLRTLATFERALSGPAARDPSAHGALTSSLLLAARLELGAR